jgi:hypothetical protein
MAEEFDLSKIVSGINISRKLMKPKVKRSTVIKSEELGVRKSAKTQIVGGDSDDVQQAPPTIVIEKDGDRISRIIVKCPCGRHSELLCEYDDSEDEDDGENQQ